MKKIRNSNIPVYKIPKAQYGFNPSSAMQSFSATTPSYYQNMFNDPNFGQAGDRNQVQLAQNAQQTQGPITPTVPQGNTQPRDPVNIQPLPTTGLPPSLQDRFDEQISGMEIPEPDTENISGTGPAPPPPKPDPLMTGANIVGGLAQQVALSHERPQVGLAATGGALQGLSIGSKFGPWGAGAGAAIGGLIGLAGAAGARSNYEDAKYREIDDTIRRNEYTGEDLGRLPGQFQLGGEVSLSSFVTDSARNIIRNYTDVDETDLKAWNHYASSAKSLDDIQSLEKEYMTPTGRKRYRAKYGLVGKKKVPMNSYQHGGEVSNPTDPKAHWDKLDKHRNKVGDETFRQKNPGAFNWWLKQSPKFSDVAAVDTGQGGTEQVTGAIVSLVGQVAQIPQSLATEAFTDREYSKAFGELTGHTSQDQARPSDHIDNPYAGFAADVFLDPLALGGAGTLGKGAIKGLGKAASKSVSKLVGNNSRKLATAEANLPTSVWQNKKYQGEAAYYTHKKSSEDVVKNVQQYMEEVSHTPGFEKRASKLGMSPESTLNIPGTIVPKFPGPGVTLGMSTRNQSTLAKNYYRIQNPTSFTKMAAKIRFDKPWNKLTSSEKLSAAEMESSFHNSMKGKGSLTKAPPKESEVKLLANSDSKELRQYALHEYSHAQDKNVESFLSKDFSNSYKPEIKNSLAETLDDIMGPPNKRDRSTRYKYLRSPTEVRARLTELRGLANSNPNDYYNESTVIKGIMNNDPYMERPLQELMQAAGVDNKVDFLPILRKLMKAVPAVGGVAPAIKKNKNKSD